MDRLNQEILMTTEFAAAKKTSGIPGMNLVCRYAVGYNTTRRGNPALLDSDTGAYHCPGAYPRAIFKYDRLHLEAEGWIRPIVISGTQVRPL